ncbi:DUF6503 family protein [Ekhidna sp.]|uniref:DUF6503 family protein n=1 Tax=Ekhidna sp. TaxID=2608089 RepID=UPI003B507E1B
MKKVIVLLSIIAACSTLTPTAQQVVDEAIKYSGTEVLRNATASFSFRDINYQYQVNGGSFTYTRIQQDSVGNEVKDILNNSGLVRTINGDIVEITDEKSAAYTSSVNSVIYFAFLPYKLNDAAVNKSYEGQVSINNETYHKIKVTFDQEGGGEDFEDVFYYWFDSKDYSLDYLAYIYEEEEGTGTRFRVAYNTRIVNGVVIQDYKNLKPRVKGSVELKNIDQAYQSGDLVELSLIELEDVVISIQ